MSANNGNSKAPNFQALQHFVGQLVEQQKKSQFSLGPIQQPKPLIIRKCLVCGSGDKLRRTKTPNGSVFLCPGCRTDLESGGTAFVCRDGRSLMAKSGAPIKDSMIGKIVEVSVATMDELVKKAAI